MRAGAHLGQGVREGRAAHSINPLVSGSWVVRKVLEERAWWSGGWRRRHMRVLAQQLFVNHMERVNKFVIGAANLCMRAEF